VQNKQQLKKKLAENASTQAQATAYVTKRDSRVAWKLSRF